MQSGPSTNARRFSPADDAILRTFDDRARRSRGEVLVRSAAWSCTVGDVDAWSRRIAADVEGAGLEPGDVIGLAAPNGPAFLAGFLALRRAGCTALLIDDHAPREDRARITESIGARAVLACRMDESGRAPAATLSSGASAPRRARAPQWAAIKLTSGSTGTPRGVAASAEALLADERALAQTMGVTEEDRVVAAIPMSHSYGFTTLALAALARGVQLIVPSDAGPLAPIVAARNAGATVFPTVPAYVQAVLRTAQPDPWPESLRLVITAGAALAPSTAARFREINGRRIHAFYGSSECGGICYDRTGDAGERGTVGTPVEGVRLSLLPVDGQEGGLLVVQSAAVGETYVPDPDPRLTDGRFETADLAIWRDGEIVLRNRTDRTINVRSFKVDPAEVEQVLSALPGVEDALVLGVAGPDGPDTLVRAVIASRSGTIDAAAVIEWCRERLAEHKVPRSVVVVDALPRTPRGKIDLAAVTAIPVSIDRRRAEHV